jgi:ATP-dependent helicase/nuclease subunit B
MTRVIRRSSAAERLGIASEFIGRFPAGTEILLVGPTRDAVDDLVREIARQRAATFGLHRFSLLQLAVRLAMPRLAESSRTPASGLGTEAVAARAAFESSKAGHLNYFGPVADLPGFVHASTSTLSEIRLAGVPAGQLEAFGASGHDNAELLKNYEQQLVEASLADRAGILSVATDAVLAHEGRFVGLPLLLLDAVIEWRCESDLVRALLGTAPEALVTIPSGDTRTWQNISQLPAIEQLAVQPIPDKGSLRRLNEFLFSPTTPPQEEPDGEVLFFSAPGEERECVEVARLILQQAANGLRFDQIAILLRDPKTYTSLLETALRRAGIPAYFARGTARPDPSGRAFLALLACANARLSAKRFAEYLSFGQVPQLTVSGEPPVNREFEIFGEDEAFGSAVSYLGRSPLAPFSLTEVNSEDSDQHPQIAGTLRAPWRWEELLVEAAVVGGKERWARRLTGLENELRLKVEELGGEEADSPRVNSLRRDLQNLGHLRNFALPVIDFLAALPQAARWHEWLVAMGNLAPMVLRSPGRVLAVLADLKPMGPVGPVALDEVIAVLQERLTDLQQEPPAYRYGRVFVGTPEHGRGRCFEIVFIPGLAERLFPQKLREDPLLLDELRVKFDSKLPTAKTRLEHERLLLALAAGAARKRVILSYPRLEIAEGRPRVPSFYALEVQRAITGNIPSFDQLAQQAERVARSRLAWPAPVNAQLAIDDAEHDLAMLEPLLRGKAEQVRGGAAYLLELNPHLARSLRSRWARWSRDWREQDGFLSRKPLVLDALQQYRLSVRPYSVSALQKFAVCPYQFFLSAVHRLEPRQEVLPLEQLDPLTRGRIFHRVQAETLRRLKGSGILPLVAANLEAASGVLDETLNSVAAKYKDDLAPAIERVWQDEIDGLRADLRGWLRAVADSGTRWLPLHFEFGFGLPAANEVDPASVSDPIRLPCGYLLHGIVDLIEERADNKELRITDHKTGRDWAPDPLVVSGGEVLQPTLYSMAVEFAVGRPVLEGRLFYCTTAGHYSERRVELNGVARNNAEAVLRVIDAHLGTPFLVPAPKPDSCNRCDFREVCGPYEELRMARKPQDQLAQLLSVRDLS